MRLLVSAGLEARSVPNRGKIVSVGTRDGYGLSLFFTSREMLHKCDKNTERDIYVDDSAMAGEVVAGRARGGRRLRFGLAGGFERIALESRLDFLPHGFQ